MARGNKPPVSDNSKPLYLQLDLTKGHKADLVKWLENNPDFWDLIDKAVDSGLKFSCSHDAYNDCLQATLTKLSEDPKKDRTVVLVGRGPDLYKAIQALFFKYEVVLQRKLEDGDLKNGRGVTDWS